ncbi:hypothetical protein AOLI_G00330050 [Acnodon oligacanthus]
MITPVGPLTCCCGAESEGVNDMGRFRPRGYPAKSGGVRLPSPRCSWPCDTVGDAE